jgi:hypothetical protein
MQGTARPGAAAPRPPWSGPGTARNSGNCTAASGRSSRTRGTTTRGGKEKNASPGARQDPPRRARAQGSAAEAARTPQLSRALDALNQKQEKFTRCAAAHDRHRTVTMSRARRSTLLFVVYYTVLRGIEFAQIEE